jgi:D-alanyl-D-alanine carboxypeptidase-like protein
MTKPYKHAHRASSVLLIGALALGPSGCGGRSEEPLSGSSSVLQVNVPGGLTGALLARVRSVPGVSATAAVSLASIRVESPGGRAAKLNVAEVEPVSFDALAPLLLGTDVAPALNDGAVLLPRAQRERLGLRAGEALTVRPVEGPAATLPVAYLEEGALFADGIVASGATWFRSSKPTLLFVGVAPGADGGRVANALAASLKQSVTFGAPSRPSIGGRAASRLFGSFSYVVHPNGTISPDPRWVRANIYGRTVAILGRLHCHRVMLPQLARAMREIELRHLAGLIDARDFHSAGGCYVARTMMWDPANPPSLHAWGLAIDINVSSNPWGARPRQDPRIVAIFKKWGFRWGGDWSPPDGMHFELASLIG